MTGCHIALRRRRPQTDLKEFQFESVNQERCDISFYHVNLSCLYAFLSPWLSLMQLWWVLMAGESFPLVCTGANGVINYPPLQGQDHKPDQYKCICHAHQWHKLPTHKPTYTHANTHKPITAGANVALAFWLQLSNVIFSRASLCKPNTKAVLEDEKGPICTSCSVSWTVAAE